MILFFLLLWANMWNYTATWEKKMMPIKIKHGLLIAEIIFGLVFINKNNQI